MTGPRLVNRTEISRFMKFSVVGTVGFVIDFGIFNLLSVVFGVPEYLAQVVSFVAAGTSNFIWNRFWTYPDSRSKPVGRQAAQFGIVSVIGLVIRTIAFTLLLGPCNQLAETLLALPAASSLNVSASWLGANMTLGLVILIVLFWNFLANRLWTYADVDRPGTEASTASDTPPV